MNSIYCIDLIYATNAINSSGNDRGTINMISKRMALFNCLIKINNRCRIMTLCAKIDPLHKYLPDQIFPVVNSGFIIYINYFVLYFNGTLNVPCNVCLYKCMQSFIDLVACMKKSFTIQISR